MYISYWSYLHDFFYVLSGESIKHVDFSEERTNVGEPGGWRGWLFVVILFKFEELWVVEVVVIDLS